MIGTGSGTGREGDLVELVSPDGTPVGSATVADAHTAPGHLHRAFSVLLFDEGGRTLLQLRSAGKTRFPLRWANSCCGHPKPGESVVAAAVRRLAQELGVGGVRLVEVGVYLYTAEDPVTGRVECEYDHVIVGRVVGELTPSLDPAEVARTRWAPARALPADVAHDVTSRHVSASQYAPWLPGVLSVAVHSESLSDLL